MNRPLCWLYQFLSELFWPAVGMLCGAIFGALIAAAIVWISGTQSETLTFGLLVVFSAPFAMFGTAIGHMYGEERDEDD